MTTFYNHKYLSTKEKPLIPNIIFKSLVWLLKNKFYEESQYITQNYSLTPFQKQFIENLNKISRSNI